MSLIHHENSNQDDDELTTYARLIGIELPNESYLLPIAQEGLHEQIPENWAVYEHKEENGNDDDDDDDDSAIRHYYYNHETQESSWFHPCDQQYKDKVIEFRNFVRQCAYALGINHEEEEKKPDSLLMKIAAEMAFCPMPTEGNWEMHRDEEGSVFFQHDVLSSSSANVVVEKESTWDHPYLAHFSQQVQEIKKQLIKNNNNAVAPRPSSSSSRISHKEQEEVVASDYYKVRSTTFPDSSTKSRAMPNLNSNSVQNQKLPESVVHHQSGSTNFVGSNYNEAQVRNQKLAPPKNSDGSSYVPGFDDPRDHFHPVLGAPFRKDFQGFPTKGSITKDDFDEIWGPLRPKGWSERNQSGGTQERKQFDEWFGPPVKVGTKRPEGPPKRALTGRVALPNDPQQQQRHQVNTSNNNNYQILVNIPTIVAFGRYIGINPETEPHLLQIAATALQSPLPPNWTAVKDPSSGRTYFACMTDGKTSWDHPMKEAFCNKVVEMRNATTKQQQQKPNATPAESETTPTTPSETDSISFFSQNISHLEEMAQNYNFGISPDHLRHRTATSPEARKQLQQVYDFLRLPETQQNETLARYYPQWTTYTSDDESHSGQKYYFNKETQETSWDNPIVLELKKRLQQ